MYFATNSEEFNSLYKQDKIISLFHSHTNLPENPSLMDKETSESLCLPSYIFSNKTKRNFLYFPKSQKRSNLIGRVFVPEFQDCVCLLKDYFGMNARDINWARQGENSNNILFDNLNIYFDEVNKTKFKKHDVLVFNPDISNLYHVGMYIEDGYLLHHPIDMLSKKELLTDKHLSNVYKVYRYKG